MVSKMQLDKVHTKLELQDIPDHMRHSKSIGMKH